MASKWIEHVKKCASDFGINYPQAMKDPRTRASYHKMKGGSQITKAEKWRDFSYDTAKQAIHLVPKAAKAYGKSYKAIAKTMV